jgi:hypothetical protein
MKRAAFLTLLVCSGFIFLGCEDSDRAPPVGTDIGGNWTGYYERPGYHEDLQAEVEQDGSSLVITTTLAGNGHQLTGTIDTGSFIYVTDGYDGETWTSYGQVTPNYIYIRDFLWDPDLGNRSPVQGIYLFR